MSYPFVDFPISDVTIQFIDHVDLPAHTMTILRKREETSPVISLDEDGWTLATLLELCYPFAESYVKPCYCSVPLVARVRKTAEEYGMSTVVQAARHLMMEQRTRNPPAVLSPGRPISQLVSSFFCV
ncbi:hypothetical protein QCA50_018683 [Cerrena zonata]|uniref:Uncharacterized protein n=1 Tax=Cerrena zonata TaxID=2478898 RepID=A0AAW0FGU4_9APHY